jgi:hypothetical protein
MGRIRWRASYSGVAATAAGEERDNIRMGLRRWLRSWPIFERRWIPDGAERNAHRDAVRRRLGAGPPPAEPPAAAAPDQRESTAGRALPPG